MIPSDNLELLTESSYLYQTISAKSFIKSPDWEPFTNPQSVIEIPLLYNRHNREGALTKLSLLLFVFPPVVFPTNDRTL